LAGILSDRDTIAKELRDTLDKATDPWGIFVERVEVKDVLLPHNLQRAMAAEAEAVREAKAKVIFILLKKKLDEIVFQLFGKKKVGLKMPFLHFFIINKIYFLAF